MQKNYTKIIIGIIIILIGLGFLSETTGIWGSLGFNTWRLIGLIWPAALLFAGVKMILNQNTTAGVIVLTFGLGIFLSNLFRWNFFGIMWPLILIAVGVSIFLKQDNDNINTGMKKDERDKFQDSVIFWGVDKELTSKDFKKADLNVAFGGYKLDMRDAKISKDGAKITANTAFGGIEIIAPKDCKVVSRGSGIFGGWDNKLADRDTKSPVLEISGSAIFGGIEIKE